LPLVSVIIPTYNRAGVLRRAVDSVLAQTYQDVELLVIDNGSTDQTSHVIAEYGDRVMSVVQENRGVSSARNTGIRAASGEYVALLDSDDAWLPDKLARQLEVMTQHPEIPLCHTEEIWIRRGVRVNPMKKHQKYGGYIFSYCLPLCVISPSSVLIRRWLFEEVGEFDETFPACEDYELWLRITKTYPVSFLDAPLVVKYGGHSDQLSRQYWGLDRFRIKALEKLLQTGGLSPEQHGQTVQELQRKCRIVANGCLKRKKLEDWAYYSHLPEKYL
jgi:glycosyltransferase involved in cell wall biosynthesis